MQPAVSHDSAQFVGSNMAGKRAATTKTGGACTKEHSRAGAGNKQAISCLFTDKNRRLSGDIVVVQQQQQQQELPGASNSCCCVLLLLLFYAIISIILPII